MESKRETVGLPVVLDPSHEAIRRAEAGVREAVSQAEADAARPCCHFRPPARWMNDPNGTLFHDGWYHLFFQHNPFGDEWGSMHWGHARSRDLVRWEPLPVALAPTPEAGEGHCFSGCGWIDAAGRPVLFYTSWPPETACPPGAGGRAAQQWIVRPDGQLRRFEKPAVNPLLVPGSRGVPELDPDWRDPFVFEEAGRTFMLLGATRGGDAVIPLFETDDPALQRWRYRGVLHRAPRDSIDFFECPSLCRIAGTHVLIYSAHRPAEYVTGRFDPEAGAFHADGGGRIDHSPHLYAPGIFAREPRGRHVLAGWVRGWEGGRGWNGVLGFPRVLELGDDGRLRQRPLPELAGLRGSSASLPSDSRLEREGRRLDGFRSRALELDVRLRLEGGSAGLRLVRSQDGDPVVSVTLRRPRGSDSGEAGLEAVLRASTLSFRLQPGQPPAAAAGEGAPTELGIPLPEADPSAPVELRLFWDRSLLELFLADGAEACTLVVDASGEPLEVEAFAERGGARFASLTAWSLEEIW